MSQMTAEEIARRQAQGSTNARPAAPSTTVNSHGKYTGGNSLVMTPDEVQSYTEQRVQDDPGLQDKINQSVRAADNMVGSGIGKAITNESVPPKASTVADTVPSAPSATSTPVTSTSATELDKKPDNEVKEEVTQAIKEDVPEEDRPKAYKQTRSIWQAWKDGEFGSPDTEDAKSARNYFILNQIATFAAAQAQQSAQLANVYRGGTVDPSAYTTPMSEWEAQQSARRQNTLENELSSETAVNTAETNQKIADEFKSSPQATQALNNLILEAQAGSTPEQLRVSIENMKKAGTLTDAQTSYLQQQINWFDTNQALGALKALVGMIR